MGVLKYLSPLVLLPMMTIGWSANRSPYPRYHKHQPTPLASSRRSTLFLASSPSDASPSVYSGPVLQDPSQIVAGISIGELGLDLAVAPSTVAPGTLGLFAILTEGTERTTIPSFALLCGYSREGTFTAGDEGDKTVGFAIAGPDTAVFFERRPMSVLDALELAAETKGENNACGLAGHLLVQNDAGGVDVYLDDNPDFGRYFVPAFLNRAAGSEEVEACEKEDELSVQNFGQMCNDLAWSYDDPPKDKEEYNIVSDQNNIIQLVWRLEFDPRSNCLVPTWPVSVTAKDITFENSDEFMEMGTRYGWTYWQATVDLEAI